MIARNDRSEHQSGRFAGKTVQSIHDVYPRLLILALQADSSETQTTRIEITNVVNVFIEKIPSLAKA